jgi:hypothetical protein
LADVDGTRRVIAHVVQRRLCSVAEIRAEVRAAARQRTASSRVALIEVAAGVRSVAEAKARLLIRRGRVCEPLWNAELLLADGTVLCTPDAYWPHLAVALEIDSLAWHLEPESYRRTKQRERLLTSHGVQVIAFTPTEILENPDGFVVQVKRFLELAAQRPVPQGITVRPSAG